MRKVRLEPQPAKIRHGKDGEEAWYYKNQHSIDVIVQCTDKTTVHCRIARRHLADWIKRTEPPK